MAHDPRSQHPTDRLIRDLIGAGRAGSPDEIAAIVARVSGAPFDMQLRAVPVELRGRTYLGHRLLARADSLFLHLARRVVLDAQWQRGTTPEEYVDDLRRAVLHPATRIAVYERRGGPIALFVAANSIPASHRGAAAAPWLCVVYAADRGSIVSGYQASDLDKISIPRGAQWLR